MSRHHCHNHPSREARVSCRTCGRWLCDRCADIWRGRVHCSRSCLAKGLATEAWHRARSLLGRPVPAPWTLGIVAAAAALLLATVVILGARLLLESGARAPSPRVADRPAGKALEGRLAERDGAPVLEIQGPPGTGVLLTLDGVPSRVVMLDGNGSASVRDLPAAAEIQLFPLGAPLTVAPPVRTRPASTATPTPSPSPSATPTATPSPTPTATATPTPAPTATATPEPTATPTLTPPPPPVFSPTPIVVRPLRLTRVPEMRAAPSPTPRPRKGERRAPPVATKHRIPDLHLVPDAGPRIALTFDGGSTADGTTELLDLLRRLDLRVTLFVTGKFIENHPGLVRRAVLDGHEVGNHTFSHPHLTTYAEDRRHRLRPGVTRSWFRGELLRTEELFRKATGRDLAPYWRAPYGEENGTLRAWAYELGYIHVRWSSLRGASLDSRDWVDDEHSALYEDTTRMMRRLLRFPQLGGGIVLMHLSTHRREPPWRVLPPLLEALEARGIRATSVTELLEASPTWRPRLEEARRRRRR